MSPDRLFNQRSPQCPPVCRSSACSFPVMLVPQHHLTDTDSLLCRCHVSPCWDTGYSRGPSRVDVSQAPRTAVSTQQAHLGKVSTDVGEATAVPSLYLPGSEVPGGEEVSLAPSTHQPSTRLASLPRHYPAGNPAPQASSQAWRPRP